MGILSRVLWHVLGEAAFRRRNIDVVRLKLPAPRARVNKIHVPRVDELPVPGVRVGVDPKRPLLAAGEREIDVQLLTPHVHGKILRSARQEQEPLRRDPIDRAGTISREARDRLPEAEEYLPEALYALLLPPVSDLIGVTFEWPADLYPFQIDGVKFLIRRRHALLADEMGLGKTIQAIAAVRILLKAGMVHKVLVVCPASIKHNWLREFRKWAPEVQCEVIEGNAEDRRWCWRYPCHVLITNYLSLIRDFDYGYCEDLSFDLVILDEAQRIKNPETKTAQTVKALQRRSGWGLTGTPVENSANDLRSIFGFIHPRIRLDHAGSSELRRRIEPYFLRRRKKDVLKDLPPKRMADRWLALAPAQREAYAAAETEGIAYLRDLGKHITITHVLALITRLKQICNFDPKTEQSCKVDYLREVLTDIAASGDKVLIFSQFVETLQFIAARLKTFEPLVYHGGMPSRERDNVVEQFTTNRQRPLLLVSLRAGGLGLNLQAASWVFHFDRWWTPAAERQAEDRAHRIGQSKGLMIERLMCENTIEERIHEIQQRKQRVIDDIVEYDYEDGVETLSVEEIFEAVGLEPELAQIARRRSP